MPTELFKPEFLSEDFRTNRPLKLGLPMSDQITIHKHQQCLPPDVIKGKHILDIGCFIAQTGHWCLNNGAASYTGVEINPDFANKARELMTRYHSGQAWNIITSSLEDYYAAHNDKFDIVYSWNVLFYHHDHTWFLKQLAARGDRVIVSGRHPKVMWRGVSDQFTDSYWHDFEYNIPYQEWQDRVMTGVAGHQASLKNLSANSSIAAVKLIMRTEGFSGSLSAYENLKKLVPEHFGMFRDSQIGFYVIDFERDSTVEPPSTMDRMYKDPELWNKNYRPWDSV